MSTVKPILAERFKTKMCKKFEEQGSCPYESRCMFAHGEREMRTKQMNLNDNLVTEEAIKAFQKARVIAAKSAQKKKERDQARKKHSAGAKAVAKEGTDAAANGLLPPPLPVVATAVMPAPMAARADGPPAVRGLSESPAAGQQYVASSSPASVSSTPPGHRLEQGHAPAGSSSRPARSVTVSPQSRLSTGENARLRHDPYSFSSVCGASQSFATASISATPTAAGMSPPHMATGGAPQPAGPSVRGMYERPPMPVSPSQPAGSQLHAPRVGHHTFANGVPPLPEARCAAALRG